MQNRTKVIIVDVVERATVYTASILFGYYLGSHAAWASFTGFAVAVVSVVLEIWRKHLETEHRQIVETAVKTLRAAGETFAVDDEGRVYISERLRAELAKSQDPAKRHTTQEH